ncbi:TIGR02206 family membrane protein [Halalkalibacillus sediminis]|uniref:TIGR02206 family membrane protein n=1 Tax=Halalkalibacillus sediminis TaxID=2018042 RepID=A0A2I0QVM9_9BACI|nr:TIGR02206 family membrane protein [Halalkalibacillus sediminis]PKR78397.1 TIGR02206 family membrane protein [Halalkalibacillus sediminis]
MTEIIGFERDMYPFQTFSMTHILAIAFMFLSIAVLYKLRHQLHSYKKIVTVFLVFLLLISEITFHLWFLWNGRWDVSINLPLQLCSLSIYLCVFMLISKNYRVFEVCFFISMAGAVIAIITPELFFGYPHLRFFQFFIAHIAIILSCFYMLWVEKFLLTFSSVIRSFVFLNLLATIIFIINQQLGSNYMFLAHKPSNSSIIDYLGPYPWYILSLEIVAILIFLLIYLLVSKFQRKLF